MMDGMLSSLLGKKRGKNLDDAACRSGISSFFWCTTSVFLWIYRLSHSYFSGSGDIHCRNCTNWNGVLCVD